MSKRWVGWPVYLPIASKLKADLCISERLLAPIAFATKKFILRSQRFRILNLKTLSVLKTPLSYVNEICPIQKIHVWAVR
jgi:hypothetical protein